MQKDDFKKLFERIANEAVKATEKSFDRTIPHDCIVELHGTGVSGLEMPVSDAIDHLYLDADTSYAVIDIEVKYVKNGVTVLFVRPSSHAPVPYNQTWYSPEGNGPFKVITPMHLTDNGKP